MWSACERLRLRPCQLSRQTPRPGTPDFPALCFRGATRPPAAVYPSWAILGVEAGEADRRRRRSQHHGRRPGAPGPNEQPDREPDREHQQSPESKRTHGLGARDHIPAPEQAWIEFEPTLALDQHAVAHDAGDSSRSALRARSPASNRMTSVTRAIKAKPKTMSRLCDRPDIREGAVTRNIASAAPRGG